MSAPDVAPAIAEMAVPPRVAMLPRDHRGYPVPWFVAWVGKPKRPEFRVIGTGKIDQAIREQRCWICGGLLFGQRAYVIGPMCAVNRVSSEPPSHRACAVYAAKACPFLIKPHMRRRPHGMPDEAVEPAGVRIERNPGVALVWVTGLTQVRNVPGGVLFDVGHPASVSWYCGGRAATRAEVVESIESGLPILRAAAEKDGPGALAALGHQMEIAMRLLPAEASA